MRHACRIAARLLLVLIAASPSHMTQDYQDLIQKCVAQTKRPGARPGLLTRIIDFTAPSEAALANPTAY
jgi:hypothetical protein